MNIKIGIVVQQPQPNAPELKISRTLFFLAHQKSFDVKVKRHAENKNADLRRSAFCVCC